MSVFKNGVGMGIVCLRKGSCVQRKEWDSVYVCKKGIWIVSVV